MSGPTKETLGLAACVSAVMGGRWRWLLLSSLFINLGILVTPMFATLVYDKVVHNGVFETLWALVIGVLLFLAMELTVRQLRARSIERVASRLDQRIDERLLHAVLRPSKRSAAQPGIAARFLTLYRDLSSAREFFSSSYFLAFSDLPFLAVTLLVIGIIAWPLLLVVVFWVVTYALGALWFKQRSLKVSRRLQFHQTAKLAMLTDALSSLDALRTGHAGARIHERFVELARESANCSGELRLELVRASHWAQAMYMLSYVSLVAAGSYLVFSQWMSMGTLIAVSMLGGRTLSVIANALATLARWQELRQSLQAIAPYVTDEGEDGMSWLTNLTKEGAASDEPTVAPPMIRRTPEGIAGSIAIDRVSHHFGEQKNVAAGRDVLRDVSLRIQAGEKIGLLGRPGSGKSTLLRIMAGAVAPSEGEVRVDHVALGAIPLDDRASWLSFKPQEAPLIAGTLEDNILLNLPPDADMATRQSALEFAIEHANLQPDLQSGELSLDRWIEEYGANLSGGQRQKVSLARALAVRPRVLLLDEPNSGLDTESERMIAESLRRLPDITLIVVSHSARMLSLTSRLIVLEQGRVLADGPTERLLVNTNT
ncbi:MAG TPA: ATP-binding cassette domain-containing protein [Rhodocyclaceae bacterium]|nr:ATP-binding cassette domain-containing protein [Rhodocyclaceae bacterium]